MSQKDKNRAKQGSGERNSPGRRSRAKAKAKTNTKNSIVVLVCLIIAIILAACLFLFLVGERYFRTRFAWGTEVNGESVAGLTEAEVKAELNRELDGYTLTVTERTGDGSLTTETITGAEIGLELSFDSTLGDALAGQSGGRWLTGLFAPKELEISTMVQFNETAWEKKMDALQCFQEDFVEKPRDAYLSDYEEGVGYTIVEAIPGNQTDQSKVTEVLREAVLDLKETVDLEEEGCYRTAVVSADDSSLAALKAALEKYTDITITYTFGDTQEVLDGNTIKDWLSIDDEDKVTLDEDCVTDYVASLRKKYDTIFRPRTFTTSYGEDVYLEDGDYGWWMNYVKEGEELLDMLENGESGERTPVYYQTAAAYGAQDYGDTYVEVNLTAQHLFFYKDGEMVLESDLVSGNPSNGNETPEGVYGITYKETNATLVGENYSSPESYRMPFNGNVGLHDATWRSQFGKNFYKSHGSHGCVNLPYEVAKTLYSQVEKGTAVIVYNLEGTESDSVTEQGDEEIAQATIDAIEKIGTVTKNSEDLITRARDLYDDLSSSQRSLVTNYDALTAAEQEFKALKND